MSIDSQQVSFWDVHTFVAPLLESVGSWPLVGSPRWCALADDDSRKIAALYDAAQHHSLRVETAQAALAEVSRDISAAADWNAIGSEIHQRADLYAARPWLKRKVS